MRILAGDVGGTKVNLALCEIAGSDGSVKLQHQRRYASALFTGLDQILARYFEETGIDADDIQSACFGVPGPVTEGRCQTVNLPWVIDSRLIAPVLPKARLKLVNDLEAMAHGLATLKEGRGLVTLRSAPVQNANRALIAPGTGLGQALLFWDGHKHLVAASEGGHTDFGPQDDMQIELLQWLWPRHKHVSWEHVASGPAIHRLYRFLKETNRAHEPRELAEALSQPAIDPSPVIGAHALKGSPEICVKTMDLWLFCLGAEAGNLALKTLCRGGLFIGGGVVPHILELFRRPAFFEGFDSKGRMTSVIKTIPIFAVTDEHTALYGAALAAAAS